MGRAPVRVERQPRHLLGGGRDHLLAVGVADLAAEQRGQRVDVAPALRVEHVWALATLQDQQLVGARSVGAVAGEVQQQVLVRRALEIVVAHATNRLRRRRARYRRRGQDRRADSPRRSEARSRP
jgi:hypothetical protein